MLIWLEKRLEFSHGNHKPVISMEGLRGLAVFMVFWVHYSSLINPWLSGKAASLALIFHGVGNLGVDLFFVLSGYLIYGSILSKPKFELRKYAVRRFQRIYPPFIVVFAIYLVLSFAFPAESKLPNDLCSALVYIAQNLLLLPGIFDIQPIITVAWSLSYEAFYYILIPLFFLVFNQWRWSSVGRITFWSCLSFLGFLLHELWQDHIRLLMFVTGILLFEIYEVRNLRVKARGEIFFIAALSISGLSIVYYIDSVFLTFSVFAFFLLFCLCAFNPVNPTYAWLVVKPLRWFGNMSYSYYLLHGLILKFAFFVLEQVVSESYASELLFYWFWLPCFVLTIAGSFALFLVVERPYSLGLPIKIDHHKADPL